MKKITIKQAMEEGWYIPNTNNGFCMCGCGELSPISERSSKKLGIVVGYPRQYIYNHHRIGKICTEEHKQNVSKSLKGRVFTEEHLKNMSKAMKGRIISDEWRAKLCIATAKEKNPNWKGGISSEAHLARTNKEYIEWSRAVKERDDWTCQNLKCNKRGGDLHSHHIKPFAEYPELRYEVTNGITLCVPCHRKVHSL